MQTRLVQAGVNAGLKPKPSPHPGPAVAPNAPINACKG